jgi:hypothetical protein
MGRELKFFDERLMRLIDLDPMRGHTYAFVVDAIIRVSASSLSGWKRYALPKDLWDWVRTTKKVNMGHYCINTFSRSGLMDIVRCSQINAPCEYVAVNNMTTNKVESIMVPL